MMPPSLRVLRASLALAEAGVAHAICTVLGAQGSVPGRTGAKMLVRADGTQEGTVGGAGLEEKVRTLAVRCIQERHNANETFHLSRFREGGLDSLCGGTVDIGVEYMAGRPHLLICGGGHVMARLCDLGV